MQGYIKIHKKIQNWEWAQSPDTMHLLVWCNLLANYEEKKWQGVTIKRGQFIAGIYSLSEQTGLTPRKIRTCMQRLVDSGELKRKSTNKYTLYTVVKYSVFQDTPGYSDKQTTIKRQSNDKQTTTTNQTNKLNQVNIKKLTKKKMLLQEWEKDNGQICAKMFTPWLSEKNYNMAEFQKWLDDSFRLQCQAKGYEYIDFTAVAKNWFNAEMLKKPKHSGEPLVATDQRTAVLLRAGKAYRAEDGKIYAS